jgi:RimJ/RimL family protein N-acetyltransferase
VKASTLARIVEGWADTFGLARGDLRGGATHVTTAGDDRPRLLVLRLPDVTLVRGPPEHHDRVIALVERLGDDGLMDPAAWTAAAPDLVASVTGPSVHAYLDDVSTLREIDPRVQIAPPGVRDALERLARSMPAEEWREAGFDDPGLVFTIMERRAIVAAAHLSPWDGHLADMGFVTRPTARGRGYGTIVASAAARDAIERHDVARWRARVANAPSLAVAGRLGFERYGEHLLIEVRAGGAGGRRRR